MVSATSKKDYFFSESLELTPHPNQKLRAVLGPPIMDRRFKYSVLETTLAGSNATSATPTSLVTISQGTTDITRTGDRIRARRLWLSGKVTGNSAATGPITSRVMIVLWNQPGVGAVNAPVASQVMQGSAGYLPYAAYSRDYGDAYQVIYDVLLETNPVSTTAKTPMFHFDREILVDMEFNAGSTTPGTNNLYLFHVTDSGINQPTVLWQSTLWYEDLDA